MKTKPSNILKQFRNYKYIYMPVPLVEYVSVNSFFSFLIISLFVICNHDKID